jgi:hypothetical protein
LDQYSGRRRLQQSNHREDREAVCATGVYLIKKEGHSPHAESLHSFLLAKPVSKSMRPKRN